MALSAIVGIPRGLFSFFPGLGIQTLLVGCGLLVILSCFTNSNLSLGVRAIFPSIPAVRFPRLSWVTFLIAKSLAL